MVKTANQLDQDFDQAFNDLIDDQAFHKLWRKRSEPGIEEKIAAFALEKDWKDEDIYSLLMRANPAKDKDANLAHLLEATHLVDRLRALDCLKSREALGSTLDKVSAVLGLTGDKVIARFVEYQSDPKTYAFVLKNGQKVELNEASRVRSQSSVADKIFEQCHVNLPTFTSLKWRELLQKLLDNIEADFSLGEETTDSGLIKGWLNIYLVHHSPNKLKPGEKIDYEEPFKLDGYIYINSQSFSGHLRNFKFVKEISTIRLAKLLRLVGWEHTQSPNFTKEGRRTRIQLWKIPEEALRA